MKLKTWHKVTLSIALPAVIVAVIAIIYFIKRKYMKPTNLSQKGKDFIKSKEGLRLTAYQCDALKWTIGYGHTSGVYAGMTITKERAEELFKQDVVLYETAVRNENLNINQDQFDALVSFAFNVGVDAFKNSTLLKKIKANPDDPAIKDEFAKWNKAGGAVIAGLTTRRAEESKMYFS